MCYDEIVLYIILEYFGTAISGKARDIFVSEMGLDDDTWFRARAWVLWKATFELCNIADKNGPEALLQKRIIDEVINE